MTWTVWVLFVGTCLVADFSPGPAVLYVLSSALRGAVSRGVAASLGILSANAVYFVLSGTSLGVLMLASYNLFSWIRWAGAAYLIFLGGRALFGKTDVLGIAESLADTPTHPRVMRDGFFLQLSNPKAIVFFSALVPQFIDLHHSVALQVTILGVTSTVCEFCVLFLYSMTASAVSGFARRPAFAKWTNRAAGVMLIGAGTGLAALRRN
jgi:homoserine/homoserine lactone efflux protein